MIYLTRDRALARIERGDHLHMELRDGARQWWFEAPFEVVSDRVVSALIFGHAAPAKMLEAGDSLFGLPMNSQTWLPIAGNA